MADPASVPPERHGRPPLAVLQRWPETFAEGYSLGFRGGAAYQAGPQGTHPEGSSGRRARREYANGLKVALRLGAGLAATGPVVISERQAVWLEGIDEGVYASLYPHSGLGRCQGVLEREIVVPGATGMVFPVIEQAP